MKKYLYLFAVAVSLGACGGGGHDDHADAGPGGPPPAAAPALDLSAKLDALLAEPAGAAEAREPDAVTSVIAATPDDTEPKSI